MDSWVIVRPHPYLVAFVVTSVTTAWVFALVVAVFTSSYQALIIATPLEGAIVGYATGMKLLKNGSGKDGNGGAQSASTD